MKGPYLIESCPTAPVYVRMAAFTHRMAILPFAVARAALEGYKSEQDHMLAARPEWEDTQ